VSLGAVRKERILVIAKTYPECSEKYGCLVCVAGINEDGEWRRVYPIPYYLFYEPKYRRLRFKKWDWIEIKIKKARHDLRIESYKVANPRAIRVVGSIDDWEERRKIAEKYLDRGLNYLKAQGRSLGIIKPKRVVDFLKKKRERLDRGEQLVLEKSIQALLPEFPETKPKMPLRPKPLPWLGYRFECYDEGCRGHEMMCIDWEIQELYRKLLLKEGEDVAFEKTRQKALWMLERDLFFCVGTTWRFPTWMIISLIYPPKRQYKPIDKWFGT